MEDLKQYIREQNTKGKHLNDTTFKFQILTWHAQDEEAPDAEDDEELEYKIYMFGCDEQGRNVCIQIKDYTPYFYVKVPEHLQKIWSTFQTKELETQLSKRFRKGFKKAELCNRINIKGFTNLKKDKYLKLIFSNEKSYKFAKYYFRPINKTTKRVDEQKLPRILKIDREPLEFKIFEHNIEPYFRFCHKKDIPMAGWVEIPTNKLTEPSEYLSLCQIEHHVSWKHVSACNEEQQNNVSPFMVASFDIECVSKNRKSFPDPANPDDVIFQIGTTFYREGSGKMLKHVLTIGSKKDNYKCDPVDDVLIEIFNNERDLLKRWLTLIKNTSPDIITGYNIYNFDWSYINKRAKITKCDQELQMLSRLVSVPAKMENIKFESSAYGTNYWHFVRIPGITNVDLHKIIKRDHKLESYKLNDVAFYFNGENKEDLSPEELFKCVDGSAKDMAKAVKYNAKDTELVASLMQKLWILTKNISAANVSYIPLNYLEIKGQGIKIKSVTLHKCKKYDVVVPTADFNEECEDSFTGATVLEAKPGAYFDPIAGLDFASLYPSLMIANNLCPSTIVYEDKYLNLPDLEYFNVEWEDNNGKQCKAVYVQNVKGIIPSILEEFWGERKKYKKLMKGAKDKMTYNILNGIQLAIKVVMNSFYGILGASFGDLSERNIASTVTATGRAALKQAKYYAEKWYDCEVKYGDSVTGYTPVYLLIGNKLVITQIDKIESLTHNKWKKCADGEKEYLELTNIYTWSDDGWTKLERLIRHRLHPSKKIIRVLTHTGMVDVTDDHSLITNNNEIVSPKEINTNTRLLHKSLPTNPTETNNISTAEARIYGFFFGDGSCGTYDCPSGVKSAWNLNNSDLSMLKNYKQLCSEVYPELEWVIMDTMKSSGVYKLAPKGNKYGELVQFINNYRNETYLDKCKIIPSKIINSSLEIKEAFLEGLYDADGSKKDGFIRIDQKNQISAAQIKWLLDELGFNTSINTRADKPNVFRINGCITKMRKPINQVKKIDIIPYVGYVYDFTTVNHHFSAGVGNIVVHNTDSIYVKFNTNKKGREHFEEVFKIADEAAKRISDTFKKPMELEFEKIMYPFIMYQKKRYATVIWTNPNKYDYIDYKGIAVTRRDFCGFVRDRASEILEKLLLHKIYEFDFENPQENIDLAFNHAADIINRLLTGRVPIKELFISRSLRDNYKNENIPHVALVKKMKERDPNNVPQIGDRVRYVFVQTDKPAKTQAEKVEDPDYVIRNGIPLDYYYYYEHQLKSTMESVLSNLGLDLDKFFGEYEKQYKPVFTKWGSKTAKELAETNGLTLEDFPKGSKVKKEDVLKKLKETK